MRCTSFPASIQPKADKNANGLLVILVLRQWAAFPLARTVRSGGYPTRGPDSGGNSPGRLATSRSLVSLTSEGKGYVAKKLSGVSPTVGKERPHPNSSLPLR
jgi:hypothetical protein